MSTAPTPAQPTAARATTRGTPCAVSWDDAWVAQVEARERVLDRRICGARTIGGTPCPLPSDHVSGRCRHHGGFPLTGAPEDNRNAVVHGLYSRRLMICGTHCPAWQSCPMGGGATFALESSIGLRPMQGGPESPASNASSQPTHGPGGTGFQPVREGGGAKQARGTLEDDSAAIRDGDVAERTGWKPVPPNREARPLTYGQQLLKLPLAERPICPYETSEYNAVVTDVMRRANARAGNSMGLHLAHQVALLTVMVSRSARALAVKPLTEKMEQSGENYYMSVDKPSAALQAFERLSRELRRWMHLVEREYQVLTADRATEREHDLRRQCDTGHGPDAAATLDLSSAIAQKESEKLAENRRAQLGEMDRQIMETLLGQFRAKRTDLTAEDAKMNAEKSAEEGNKVGGRVSPRAEDG